METYVQWYKCTKCGQVSSITYTDVDGAVLVFRRIKEDHELLQPDCSWEPSKVTAYRDTPQ